MIVREIECFWLGRDANTFDLLNLSRLYFDNERFTVPRLVRISTTNAERTIFSWVCLLWAMWYLYHTQMCCWNTKRHIDVGVVVVAAVPLLSSKKKHTNMKISLLVRNTIAQHTSNNERFKQPVYVYDTCHSIITLPLFTFSLCRLLLVFFCCYFCGYTYKKISVWSFSSI